jgi:phytoene desaturase (3,4-didehydrolycopene-forming)
LKCEPNYNVWFGDGESFELSTDIAVMKREIEKWEGKAGFERYLSWMAEAHRHYELSVTQVLHRNFTSLLSMARPAFLGRVLELHPFESIYSRASKYFWTERLRRVFTFGSMYMGMSPFDAPGTYSLLQYTELAEGIWYPVGGFHKIVEKLVDIGKRLGVTYHLNTPVKSVLLSPDNKRATGIVLENGRTLTADTVIINADLVYAYNNLLPSLPSAIPFQKTQAQALSTRAGSCSSISFYWSLSRKIPQLNAHNIFLADAYRESFDSIFTDQNIPSEPSFYVNVPSRIDPSAAPEDRDTIVVLVPVGHMLKSQTSSSSSGTNSQGTGTGEGLSMPAQDWERMVSLARSTILSTITTRLKLPPTLLSDSITHESINTPPSWEEKFNLDKGSILGLSHSFFNVLSFRPRTRCDIDGVYFVGASTHPGTGVPIVLAGAKLTATQVLEDLGLQVPSTWTLWDAGDNGQVSSKAKNVDGGRGVGALDVVRARPLMSNFQVGLLMALILLFVAIFFNGDKGMFESQGLLHDW